MDKLVSKVTYDNDIQTMIDMCNEMKEKYIEEQRKNIKANKMIEILVAKLILKNN